MIKRIHVNKHVIAKNLKHGTDLPVLTVKAGKRNIYGNCIEIQGPSVLVYAEKCGMKSLKCGARVYIETKAEVLVDGVNIDNTKSLC